MATAIWRGLHGLLANGLLALGNAVRSTIRRNAVRRRRRALPPELRHETVQWLPWGALRKMCASAGREPPIAGLHAFAFERTEKLAKPLVAMMCKQEADQCEIRKIIEFHLRTLTPRMMAFEPIRQFAAAPKLRYIGYGELEMPGRGRFHNGCVIVFNTRICFFDVRHCKQEWQKFYDLVGWLDLAKVKVCAEKIGGGSVVGGVSKPICGIRFVKSRLLNSLSKTEFARFIPSTGTDLLMFDYINNIQLLEEDTSGCDNAVLPSIATLKRNHLRQDRLAAAPLGANVLVTPASPGLGIGLVRELLTVPGIENVFAGFRSEELQPLRLLWAEDQRVRPLQIPDLDSDNAWRAFPEQLRGVPINLLINNGTFREANDVAFGQLRAAFLRHEPTADQMMVSEFSCDFVIVCQTFAAFLPLLQKAAVRGEPARIVNIGANSAEQVPIGPVTLSGAARQILESYYGWSTIMRKYL